MSSDFGVSQQYKYQGQAALSNGRSTQAAYEKKARALEAEAVSDSHLAARNMKRMRQNQNAAMGSARAQRGGSGFTSEGSGSQAEVAVADVWEMRPFPTRFPMPISGLPRSPPDTRVIWP